MGALREQMDRDMVLRGMSPRTGESYLSAVAAMAKFYRRSPDQIDEAQVQHYLLHLITERKLAWSSCNIAVSALKFFYHVTLKRDQAQFDISRLGVTRGERLKLIALPLRALRRPLGSSSARSAPRCSWASFNSSRLLPSKVSSTKLV
jgi:site-specific recombinase XerD